MIIDHSFAAGYCSSWSYTTQASDWQCRCRLPAW
jgi:hypothetical protein